MNENKDLKIEKIFILALKNHKENNLKLAEDLYNKILKINPNYPGACINLGSIFHGYGRNEKAKECFKKVLKVSPSNAEANYNLGFIYQNEGENEQAKKYYKKALEVNPNSKKMHHDLGIVFKKLGKYHEAKECYEKAIEIDPNYANAYNNLANIMINLHDTNKAIVYYKKAIELKPDFAEAHKNLGIVFNDIARLEESEASFKKAAELKPNFLEALKGLEIISKQRDLLFKILQANKTKKENITNSKSSNIRLNTNPFISNRDVESKLISKLYKMDSKELISANDIRYGNGVCSDYKLFENNSLLIKTLEKDLVDIMSRAVKSDILITESFFNIFRVGSGIKTHNHITNFDKIKNISKQKYSLTYYLSVGDQNCNEPGILKLYDPDEEILPSEGSILIIPANRMHSALYNGKTDRIMIGVNFYSLLV